MRAECDPQARAAGETLDAATPYFETHARAVLAGQMHWAEYRRAVKGLALPPAPAVALPLATAPVATTTQPERSAVQNHQRSIALSLA